MLVVVALGLVAAGCQRSSLPLGEWFYGDTLALNLVDVKRVPELVYADGDEYYRVRPQAEGNDLAAVHLDVRNRKANVSLFTVKEGAVRIRDADFDDHPLINPLEQRERIPAPQGEGTDFSPFIWGSVELPRLCDGQDCSLAGWLIFEVPRDKGLVTIIWDASDTIYIRSRP